MFDPAFRYSLPEIKTQTKNLLNSEYFSVLLEEIPSVLLVINNARQVVYANRAFISKLEYDGQDAIWGQRPGECLDCVRVAESPLGCGSTEYCKVCGFANALGNSETGIKSNGECNIVVGKGETLSFSVVTRPFDLNGIPHIFFYLEDISDKRAQQYLEHAFLHDIQNSVSVLYAMHDLIEDLTAEELRTTLKDISENLMEEINSYRLITHAENNSLTLRVEEVDVWAVIHNTCNELQKIKSFRNKQILFEGNETALHMSTDRTLLRRVLLNLVKNALEASSPEEPVAVNWFKRNEKLIIQVKSMPVIPQEIQLQLFQKSFSTKGRGRGWGTYSIRLLTHQYLQGDISFVSNNDQGTIFTLRLPSLAFEA